MMSSLDEMTPEEERERTHTLMVKMARHVSMALFCTPPTNNPRNVINNGTVSFLTLPKAGQVLVTNHHVWEAFCIQRRDNPEFKLAVTGEGKERPIDISMSQVIDSDPDADLTILRYDHPEFIESIGKSFYIPKRWPLDSCIPGDDVAFLGFPGSLRLPADDGVHFQTVLLCPKVQSVSDRQLLLQFTTTPNTQWFSDRKLTDYRWGGMSGSMVYRVDYLSGHFYVTGFLRGAGDGLNSSYYAAKADLISDDGSIIRPQRKCP